jgi:uncharacterized protein (DUF2235 family)
VKTIVLCFDLDRDFGLLASKTNVFKLYLALASDETQLPLYVPIPARSEVKGRGDAFMKMLESVVKLEPVGALFSLSSLFFASVEVDRIKRYAFGDGVARQIQSACELLLNRWNPGDRIAVFGNSRSAGAALLFTQFVHEFGLVSCEMKEILPELIKRFFNQTKTGEKQQTSLFRSSFSRQCQVSFIGMWDCVGEVTWFGPGLARLRPESVLAEGTAVRHSLSIDERRRFFRPLILSNVAGNVANPGTKEVWFAGVHSDVIGSYPERESGLSQTALAWMMNEGADWGIRFDEERRNRLLGLPSSTKAFIDWPEFTRPDPCGVLHRSLRGVWWEMEILPQKRRDGRKGWWIPLGRRRCIPRRALIHRSVSERIKSSLGYSPKNLPADYEIVE